MLEPSLAYIDKNFLVVNKPAGLLTHPTSVSTEETLVDWILPRYPGIRAVGENLEKRPGIVHRLDRDTSGLILVPRNSDTFIYLKGLFASGDIIKTYAALAQGVPKNKEGIINAPIGILPKTTKRSIHSNKMSKPAVTEYRLRMEVDEDGRKFSLLELRPRTGRTHQLRVHLASIGNPILGDKIYGGKANKNYSRLMLHAWSIEFRSPSGDRVKFKAELPEDFCLEHERSQSLETALER